MAKKVGVAVWFIYYLYLSAGDRRSEFHGVRVVLIFGLIMDL